MKIENSNIEYYGYFVTHSYMSQIQRGIQSAHVIQKMYEQMEDNTPMAREIFHRWMTRDFTMIVLNGGNSAMIAESFQTACNIDEEGQFPIACFHEDEQSMEGMMTAWGIVLPKTCKDADYAPGMDIISNNIKEQEIYYRVLANLKLA